MAKYLSATDLIKSVKRRAFIPSNQSTITDQDILDFANEEMSIGILPKVLELHEDYYLVTELIPLVYGDNSYTIPYRASGNKVRDISYRDPNGNLRKMVRIGVEDLERYKNAYLVNQFQYYYFLQDQIMLVPNVASAIGSLAISYYMSPNEIVSSARTAVITGIDYTNGIISIDKVPANFSGSIQYDFIENKTPFIVLGKDLSTTAINTATKALTFDPASIPTDLKVGDYLMQAQECFIPQIPQELHSMLAQRVACRCLEALGDMQKLQMANAKLQEMEKRTDNLIDNRAESSPQKVVNSKGPLSRTITGRRYY